MDGGSEDKKYASAGSSSARQQDQNSSSHSQFSVEAPSVSLPKGGGAIKGIGEKFAANPVTGTGSMSVPIATSPGRAGFGPQLSLSYDSGAGNGIFGFGWNLSMPAITRKTNKGLPRYLDGDEADIFILSGAEDLVPVMDSNGVREILDSPDALHKIQRYRPRIEGLFARIERWIRNSDGDVHWRSLSKENILTVYGKNRLSRIVDPEGPERIFSWLICETRDDKGNAVIYDYNPDDGAGVDFSQVHERNRGKADDLRRSANRYLKRIRYGNEKPLFTNRRRPFSVDDLIENAQWMFEVVFDYGEHDADFPMPNDNGQWLFRKDAFSNYRPGFEVRTTRLCQRVLMFHHFPGESGVGDNCLVRSTDFSYSHQRGTAGSANSRNPAIYSFLEQAFQTGYKRKNGQLNSAYIKRSLPPVEFTYSQPIVQDKVEEIDPASLENLPIGVDGAAYRWTDLHGEGIPGILTEQADSWWYKSNISPISKSKVEFTPLEKVSSEPNSALAAGAQFMDLEGNGQPDVVMLDGPTPGRYQHDKQEGWQNFQPFTSRLNRSFQDPNLKFLDLDGDGHADLLISEDNAFIWHASLAEAGFAPARRVAQALDEETGPKLVFADGSQSLFLADMSGDGLTDLVRIRNGDICYWPNLGYCRFGAKINMDNAPHFDRPDQFEHSRLRLADIDGSGTTDIIYLHGDGVKLYFNQSGNSWSKPQKLAVQPRIDEMLSIAPTDLLGNGTACLVWSSPLPSDRQHRMRYVNLMGAQKPHLLIKTNNNLGAETLIEYVPSTHFYLADKAAGKPWVTKLPFPVHVVSKTTVKDKWRDTEFSSRYSYHHGYFDGVEREFRGFGRVEQVDIETYGEFIAGNANSPYITDDQTLYQPPIKTISWFHTGAALDSEHILSQFQQEYFVPNGFIENEFPEAQLPQQLTTDEWRQALRACKGLPLRQEVYELDVDTLKQGEHKPVKLFSSAYHNCNVQMLQAQANNKHAVFLVTESETITYQYDLDLSDPAATVDPRIAHTVNLNIDEYGNVLQSVAAVYPRIGEHVDITLPGDTQGLIHKVQREPHLAYTETRLTNDIDDPVDFDHYRLRLPCEVLNYELTGINPADFYFNLKQLQGLHLSARYQPNPAGLITVNDLPYQRIVTNGNAQKRIVEHVRMLFFKQDLLGPLPFGELNSLALPYETYKLALTDGLLDDLFVDTNRLTPAIRLELKAADKSGYLSGDAARFAPQRNADEYWIRSGIAGFAADAADANEHFYLPEEYIDGFDKPTRLQFDVRDLFIQSSTDPVGNTVRVSAFDYRVLAPGEMQDINENFTEVRFDVLGMPAAVAVKGKQSGGVWQGDHLDTLSDAKLHPLLDEVVSFCTSVTQDDVKARQWLDNASTRFVYHFGETVDAAGNTQWGARMAGACSITREQHVGQLDGALSPLQVALECSDGGGNVLMQKVQAEPDPDNGLPRWIINGLTVLNNKGKPVKQYEPAFSDRFGCELPQPNGVTAIIYYDAADRVVRTESPDGSVSRVEYSPWHVSSFDANDTVLEAGNDWYLRRTDPGHIDFAKYDTPQHKNAARLAAKQAGTPAQIFLDSLGRDVISVEYNRVPENTPAVANVPLLDRNWLDEKYVTFSKLDAEGKPLWIRDARGNLVMQYIAPAKANDDSDNTMPATSVPCYDIAGNLLFQHSMDGGDRWMISDATGQPFYAWDENEDRNGALEQRRYRTIYDDLRRPLEQRLRINTGTDQVIEKFVYGDLPNLFPAQPLKAKEQNLRGQLFQHHDSSGLVTNENFDFKGNLLEAKRQLISFTEDSITDWSNAVALDEVYTQKTEYDALNRMTRHENWHVQGPNPTPAIYTPRYNQRGLLLGESIELRGDITDAIVNIEYDAKGQRQKIQYGNNTATSYQYDPETFRLLKLKTIHNQNQSILQDLSYSYDPVGNITEIRDDAYEPVFFKNQQVKPRSRYSYDALYRLIKAEGRESAQATVPTGGRLSKTQQKEFPIESFTTTDKTLRSYTQTYTYDSVGNIEQMQHQAGTGSWTRDYQYEDDSNRLKNTQQGTNTIVYRYDTHGSMLNLNNVVDEYQLHWDSNDMIGDINLGGGGDVWYHYGADKERSRKHIVRNGGVIEERLYLGGMEVFKKFDANGNLEEHIETHHLFDGEQRLLLVEDVILGGSTNLPDNTVLFKYQYGNHLGSVGLELNEAGAIISYEEYHPYGTTAYSARGKGIDATRKRYRYTGMERDEESGLSYHSARYYLPWLGRWGSVDPAGLVDGGNLFVYVSCNPIRKVDISGKGFMDRVVGGFKAVGGAFEVAVGVTMVTTGVALGWTGVGVGLALAGGVVTAHGFDNVVSGARTIASDKQVDTLTSKHVLQNTFGMSRNRANLLDAAFGIVGSFGGGFAAASGKLAVLKGVGKGSDPLAKGMGNLALASEVNKGSKALNGMDYFFLGGNSTTALAKARLMANGLDDIGDVLTLSSTFLEKSISALRLLITGTGLTAQGVAGVGTVGGMVIAGGETLRYEWNSLAGNADEFDSEKKTTKRKIKSKSQTSEVTILGEQSVTPVKIPTTFMHQGGVATTDKEYWNSLPEDRRKLLQLIER